MGAALHATWSVISRVLEEHARAYPCQPHKPLPVFTCGYPICETWQEGSSLDDLSHHQIPYDQSVLNVDASIVL